MSRLFTVALCGALASFAATTASAFTDNFDDGAAATRWSAPIVDAETGVFDGNVNYAFDYGAIGIPAAPGGGGSTGIFMEVNLTDQGGDQGETVVLLANGLTLPAGDFVLTMDAYFNVETANGGTTEYGTFGVHAAAPNDPTNAGFADDDAPFRFGVSNGNGLAWQADGDAGSTIDFLRYLDPGNANTGSQTPLFPYDDLPVGSIPGVSTGPGATGPTNSWVTIGIERVGLTYTFSMNGTVIDTFVDAGGALSGGTILIGYSDPFNSVAATNFLPGEDPTPFDPNDGPFGGDNLVGSAHFIVFDNIKLVPEPASALMVALAACGLAARRR